MGRVIVLDRETRSVTGGVTVTIEVGVFTLLARIYGLHTSMCYRILNHIPLVVIPTLT